MRRRPDLFAGRVICFDRNFPGYDLITAILDAGGHVIARVKEGISLPSRTGRRRLAARRIPPDLAERPVREEDRPAAGPRRRAQRGPALRRRGGEVSETCTVITTLLDHQAAPADAVRETYLTRWSASETTFGEDKTTITGAGNRTSGPVLRSGSPRLVIQEAWAWLTATQLVRASAAAALRSRGRRGPRPAPQGPRPGHRGRGILHRRPAPRDPLHDILPGHGLIVAGRARRRGGRRRPRRPAHPERPRTAAPLRARAESPPEIPARHRDQDRPSPGNPRSPYSRPASPSPPPGTGPARKEEPPRAGGAADRGTARHPRRDTRAETMPAHHAETDSKTDTEHKTDNTPGSLKHLKSLVLASGPARATSAAAVLKRIFPQAPADLAESDPWTALQWAGERI